MQQTVFPSNYREQLATEIEKFIKDELSQYSDLPWATALIEQATTFCLGGKLARGTAFVHLAQLLSEGVAPEKRVGESALLSIGVALELFGSAVLIQDDIIDRDALRRGQATIHTQFSQWAESQKRPTPAHDGTTGAILLADILLFLVNRAIAKTADPALDVETLRAVLLQLSRQALFTGFGELFDSVGDPAQSQPTEASILQLYKTKTAHYTYGMPLTLAAIVSKQSSEKVVMWDEIGELVGTIFQIKDDELGLFGDSSNTGKAVGADIRENKQTLYYLYTRDALQEAGSAEELELLTNAYGNPELQDVEIDTVAALITKTGVRTRLEEYMQQLAEEATSVLNTLHPSAKLQSWFQEFLQFNLHRTK